MSPYREAPPHRPTWIQRAPRTTLRRRLRFVWRHARAWLVWAAYDATTFLVKLVLDLERSRR